MGSQSGAPTGGHHQPSQIDPSDFGSAAHLLFPSGNLDMDDGGKCLLDVINDPLLFQSFFEGREDADGLSANVVDQQLESLANGSGNLLLGPASTSNSTLRPAPLANGGLPVSTADNNGRATNGEKQQHSSNNINQLNFSRLEDHLGPVDLQAPNGSQTASQINLDQINLRLDSGVPGLDALHQQLLSQGAYSCGGLSRDFEDVSQDTQQQQAPPPPPQAQQQQQPQQQAQSQQPQPQQQPPQQHLLSSQQLSAGHLQTDPTQSSTSPISANVAPNPTFQTAAPTVVDCQPRVVAQSYNSSSAGSSPVLTQNNINASPVRSPLSVSQRATPTTITSGSPLILPQQPQQTPHHQQIQTQQQQQQQQQHQLQLQQQLQIQQQHQLQQQLQQHQLQQRLQQQQLIQQQQQQTQDQQQKQQTQSQIILTTNQQRSVTPQTPNGVSSATTSNPATPAQSEGLTPSPSPQLQLLPQQQQQPVQTPPLQTVQTSPAPQQQQQQAPAPQQQQQSAAILTGQVSQAGSLQLTATSTVSAAPTSTTPAQIIFGAQQGIIQSGPAGTILLNQPLLSQAGLSAGQQPLIVQSVNGQLQLIRPPQMISQAATSTNASAPKLMLQTAQSRSNFVLAPKLTPGGGLSFQLQAAHQQPILLQQPTILGGTPTFVQMSTPNTPPLMATPTPPLATTPTPVPPPSTPSPAPSKPPTPTGAKDSNKNNNKNNNNNNSNHNNNITSSNINNNNNNNNIEEQPKARPSVNLGDLLKEHGILEASPPPSPPEPEPTPVLEQPKKSALLERLTAAHPPTPAQTTQKVGMLQINGNMVPVVLPPQVAGQPSNVINVQTIRQPAPQVVSREQQPQTPQLTSPNLSAMQPTVIQPAATGGAPRMVYLSNNTTLGNGGKVVSMLGGQIGQPGQVVIRHGVPTRTHQTSPVNDPLYDRLKTQLAGLSALENPTIQQRLLLQQMVGLQEKMKEQASQQSNQQAQPSQQLLVSPQTGQVVLGGGVGGMQPQIITIQPQQLQQLQANQQQLRSQQHPLISTCSSPSPALAGTSGTVASRQPIKVQVPVSVPVNIVVNSANKKHTPPKKVAPIEEKQKTTTPTTIKCEIPTPSPSNVLPQVKQETKQINGGFELIQSPASAPKAAISSTPTQTPQQQQQNQQPQQQQQQQPATMSKAAKKRQVAKERERLAQEKAKRARFEKRVSRDQQSILTPSLEEFRNRDDAIERLLPYHLNDVGGPSVLDLQAQDASFENLSSHLLRQKFDLISRFNFSRFKTGLLDCSTSEQMLVSKLLLEDEMDMRAERSHDEDPVDARKGKHMEEYDDSMDNVKGTSDASSSMIHAPESLDLEDGVSSHSAGCQLADNVVREIDIATASFSSEATIIYPASESDSSSEPGSDVGKVGATNARIHTEAYRNEVDLATSLPRPLDPIRIRRT